MKPAVKTFLVSSVVVILLLSLLLNLFFYVAHISTDDVQSVVSESQETKRSTPVTKESLLHQVNAERVNAGVDLLIYHPILEEGAQLKAEDMNNGNYFAHRNPVTGKSGVDFTLERANGLCSIVGENIIDDMTENDDTETAIRSWKASKPHYDAILNSDHVYTGFGISGDKIVQHFCIPK